MSADWMMGGVVENDRDEARSAERFADDYDDRPTLADVADDERPERTAENACPECPDGVVISADRHDGTGHYPYGCSAGCGYGG